MEGSAGSESTGSERLTRDGSVDLKGRAAIRSKRGGWRACYFIVVYEVFERMAFYGISSNLVVYLTTELRQGTVASANNVTYWMGTGFLSSVAGAYFADAHFGRFWTFTAASLLYFLGMCLLTATVSFPSLKPPSCNTQGILDARSCKPPTNFQLGIFFSALYILALGTGGTKPNISTIGADQFDEFDPKERADKISFFNWWMFSIYLGTLFANVVLVYVQDNVSWSAGYGIPTIGLGISLLIFYSGTPFYRHKEPQGSPFAKMARVLVAAVRNYRATLPKDPLHLYELELCDYTEKRKFRITSTNSMRFLNKAAVQVGTGKNPWKLCPITHIEETKQILRLFPVLLSMFIPSTMMAQKAREMEAGGGSENGGDIVTKDGSVDLQGRPAIRSKRGGWRACYFIIVYEVFERMAFYGIASNLVLYLTRELRQGTVTSANNVTYWMGTSFVSSVVGAYIADALFGRFWTFTAASLLYFLGMCLLTATVSFTSLKPPPCNTQGILDERNCKPPTNFQLGIFFSALYILALGTGGTKPNISTIGADQFDEFDPKERADKISFFNWWIFGVFLGNLFANVILVYVQDNISWSVGYVIPTIGLGISLLIFYSGTSFYRHKKPQGSPFTKMARVLVAAVRNYRATLPKDPLHLYELELCDYTEKKKFRITSTDSMRFLNRAAVRVSENKKPWKLSPVTHIEETKQMLRLFPILFSLFIPDIMAAQIFTLFIKQGTTLNRHIGPHFQIPPGSLTSFNTVTIVIVIFLYDRYFVGIMRTWTKNPRGISLLQRLGVGHVIETIAMLVASLAEMKRLSFAGENESTGGQVPLTIFILLPQFVLMGVGEAFLVVAKMDFFYHQAPESMKSLGTSLALFSHGLGSFMSSFLLSAVASITQRNGGKGWIQNDLNASHLDYYYGFLSVLCLCNVFYFLIVCRFYVYRAEVFDSLEEKEKEDVFQSSVDNMG